MPLAVLLVACLQVLGTSSPSVPRAAGTTDAETQGTATIVGRVVDRSGAPVSRATVTATMVMAASNGPPRPLPARTFSSRTRHDGTYMIASLPRGQFTLSVARDGHYPQRDSQHSRPIDVVAGASITAPDLVMYRGGVLSGRVLDDGGEPVVGAFVSPVARTDAGGPPMRELGPRAVTDDRGVYRLYGLRPGRYTVLVRPRHTLESQLGTVQGDVPELLPAFAGAATPSSANLVAVDAEAEAVLDVRLERGRLTTITGRVAADDAAPLAQGMVSLHTADPAGAVRMTGDRLWPSGGFQITQVPPGRYLVVAEEAPGNQNQVPRAGWVTVDVTGQGPLEITIPVGRGVSAEGRIAVEGGDAGLLRRSPVRVEARPVSHGVFPGSIRDSPVSADLTFALTGLRGPRLLQVSALPLGWWVKAVTVGGRDATGGFEFPSRGTSDPIEIVVSARPTGIRVTLDGATGSLAGALVMIVPEEATGTPGDDRRLRLASAQEDGTVVADALRPGQYFAVALAPGAVSRQQPFSAEERAAFVKSYGTAVGVVEGQITTVSLRLLDR